MVKSSIHHEGTTITNIYSPNNRTPKSTKTGRIEGNNDK